MHVASILFVFAMSFGGFLIGIMRKSENKKIISLSMGLAAGVMLSTTIWSLFIPSLEYNINSYIVLVFFILGGILILFIDYLTNKFKRRQVQSWEKIYLAVTIHNIPEGIVVGMACGLSLLYKDYFGLLSLSMAIGIQNLPESLALTILLMKEGIEKHRIIKLGFYNSIVEPIFAIFGLVFVLLMTKYVAVIMSFAAGTMFYVIISEVIPESVKEEANYAIVGSLIGFVIMVILEIFL